MSDLLTNVTHERRPVFLGPNTMICMTVYQAEGEFNELWMSDYIDHQKDVAVAARQFVKNLSDLLSVRMIWELRAALAEEIDKHNQEFGTNFTVDAPSKK